MTAALALSLSLVLGMPVVAGGALGPPASDQGRKVVLNVDHSALLEKQRASTAEDTGFFIKEGCGKTLRDDHAVVVAGVADETLPTVRVSLSWIEYEESIYGVEITTARPGEEPQLLESFECECYDKELTEAIAKRLPAALEQLENAPAVVPEPAAPSPVADETEESATPDPEPSDEKAAAIGGVGIAGIVTAAVGLGMTGFGISRLVIGQRDAVVSGQEELGRIRDLRPPGRAWLGAGLGTVAVGATMLIIDLTVLRKRRTRSTAFTPEIGPHGAGVVWSGRF